MGDQWMKMRHVDNHILFLLGTKAMTSDAEWMKLRLVLREKIMTITMMNKLQRAAGEGNCRALVLPHT
jgi:hypothetical protein